MSSVFDPNVWHTISSVQSNGIRSLHWCSQQIVCNSDTLITGTNASWQIVTLTDSNSATTYYLRNRGLGPDYALGVSLGTFQGQPETQPGFWHRETDDSTQLWDLVRRGQMNGQYLWFIQNIANGTQYNLAERGEGLSMKAAATEPGDTSYDQTWFITPLGSINDTIWSVSTQSNSTSNTTTTTNDNPSSSRSGNHLSRKAIAGVAVGSVLAFIILLTITLLAARKFRKRSKLNATHVEERTPSETYMSDSTKYDDGLEASPVPQCKGTGSFPIEMSNSVDPKELPLTQPVNSPTTIITELDGTDCTDLSKQHSSTTKVDV